MFTRSLKISHNRSFFLFGARATGKTTFLQQNLDPKNAFFIDLLDPKLFAQLQANPESLTPLIASAVADKKTIAIDEVQKVPALLDVVHSHIQKHSAVFALTGSSARKLRRGSANMLAGRASVYNMFPLLHSELGPSFDLSEALTWGTLPEVVTLNDTHDKFGLLDAYTNTYVAEEIIAEQIVRNLPPFRRFLHVAAQMNGQIMNYSRIARDIDTDYSNVRNYFEILEDTLLGHKLQPYHTSVRKQQRSKAKFYWFDTGVLRALDQQLDVPPRPGSADYGRLFETFLINQIRTGLEYQRRQYQLSYLLTSSGAEIDLIVERAGQDTLCIEIKSGNRVQETQLTNLKQLTAEIPSSKPVCLYNGDRALRYGEIDVLPWQPALEQLGLVSP